MHNISGTCVRVTAVRFPTRVEENVDALGGWAKYQADPSGSCTSCAGRRASTMVRLDIPDLLGVKFGVSTFHRQRI